jgi:CPA2 family monovalent cation:H+ antiporter-2
LFPGDEICVIGTDAQVKEFKTYLHQHEFEAPKNIEKRKITLQQLEFKEELIGKSISESHIREKSEWYGRYRTKQGY